MQNFVEVLDRNDPDAVLHPTLKNEGDDTARERRIETNVRERIIPGVAETPIFPLDFCMNDLVIDAVAKKYSADAAHYPADHNAEHFLIGVKTCRDERPKLDCPFMRKANDVINSTRKIKADEIVAVYLLDADDSSENRQRFLVMTKRKVFLRNDQQVDNYDYGDLLFTRNGLDLRRRGESVRQNLLKHPFDERFLNFVREFMFLRCTTLVNVREKHPFANVSDDKNQPDMVAELAITVDEFDPKPPVGKRTAYLKLLVDAAAAEGCLEARTVLRLCYLAREFRLSADFLLACLERVAAGGLPKNKLQIELDKTLAAVGDKFKFVFVQDLLAAGLGSDGNFHRQDLLEILTRHDSPFGLENFVTHYLNFLKTRTAAQLDLQLAFQNVTGKEFFFKSVVREQIFDERLSLQLTAMGAMLNEYTQSLH